MKIVSIIVLRREREKERFKQGYFEIVTVIGLLDKSADVELAERKGVIGAENDSIATDHVDEKIERSFVVNERVRVEAAEELARFDLAFGCA